jgi:hypothetical protein
MPPSPELDRALFQIVAGVAISNGQSFTNSVTASMMLDRWLMGIGAANHEWDPSVIIRMRCSKTYLAASADDAPLAFLEM